MKHDVLPVKVAQTNDRFVLVRRHFWSSSISADSPLPLLLSRLGSNR